MYTDEQIGTLTFTGDPARFVATERVPIAPISMDFEPVQDLHGYEYPWAAGGGKNLWVQATPTTINGVKLTWNPDGSCKLKGTCTNSALFIINKLVKAGTYTLSCSYIGNLPDNSSVRIQMISASPLLNLFIANNESSDYYRTTTLNEDLTMEFRIRIEKNFAYDTTLFPQLEVGDQKTAFAPYSNICPIYGKDSATIYVSPTPEITDETKVHTIEFPIQGYNQWDEEWELGQFNNQTGLPISANDCIRSKNFIPVLPNTSYYTTYGNGNMQVFFYGADESFISQAWVSVTNLITTPNGCYKMKFRNASSYGTTYKHDISINYPATETGYYPYKGRTVYAGTLTINEDGSGQIVSTMASVDLGSFNWTLGGTTASPIFYTTIPGKKAGYTSKNVCSAYSYYGGYFTGMSNCQFASNSSYPYLYVKDLRYDNATDFKAGVTGVQLVYELEEPVTINLSVEQIKTLIGLNYVWTSDNNLITITFPYRKEIQPMAMNYDFCWTYPKAYIDKLEARIAALETAAAAEANTAAALANTREAVTEENVTEGITITEEPETEPVTKKGGK